MNNKLTSIPSVHTWLFKYANHMLSDVDAQLPFKGADVNITELIVAKIGVVAYQLNMTLFIGTQGTNISIICANNIPMAQAVHQLLAQNQSNLCTVYLKAYPLIKQTKLI